MGTEEPNKGKEGDDNKKTSSALTKKMVKIVTVMAYVSGVSGAGFLLSLYYIIFWDPNIQGVRPPGYLKSGNIDGQPQALVDPIMHQALRAEEPVGYMQEYFNNLTRGKGEPRIVGDSVMDSQPTPKALPLLPEGYHQHSAHQIHPGQFSSAQSLSNDNSQSPGPSPQQGTTRDASPAGTPHVSDEIRHHHQQQHGHPPIGGASA